MTVTCAPARNNQRSLRSAVVPAPTTRQGIPLRLWYNGRKNTLVWLQFYLIHAAHVGLEFFWNGNFTHAVLIVFPKPQPMFFPLPNLNH